MNLNLFGGLQTPICKPSVVSKHTNLNEQQYPSSFFYKSSDSYTCDTLVTRSATMFSFF